MEKIEYWQKRIKYYQRKYGKDSIEVKSAKTNLERVTQDASFYEAFPEAEKHQGEGWAFPIE